MRRALVAITALLPYATLIASADAAPIMFTYTGTLATFTGYTCQDRLPPAQMSITRATYWRANTFTPSSRIL